MPDLIITPNRNTTSNPTVRFVGLSAGVSALNPSASSISLQVLPEGQVAFVGSAGSLFSITDSLTGVVMSVGDITGLPILEVNSNDSVTMGTYNSNTLVVSGTRVGVLTNNPNQALTVVGNISSTGVIYASGGNSNFWNLTYAAVTANSASWAGSGGSEAASATPTVIGTVYGRTLSAANLRNTSIGYNAFNTTSTGVDNTAIGYRSLISNTTGNTNVAIGSYALASNTLGECNIAIGVSALSVNTSCYNIAIGHYAAPRATDYSNLLAIGNCALFCLTNQGLTLSNTALGHCAGCLLTSGYYNTMVGLAAGQTFVQGNNNTFVGFQTGSVSGNDSVAIGRGILNSNCSNFMIGIGRNALYSNTTGIENIAIGTCGSYTNSTGSYNISHGTCALFNNTTGSCNIATGFGALSSNTIGSNNTAYGYLAQRNNTTGSCNVAIGTCSLLRDTTGANNVAIGFDALAGTVGGASNTGVGVRTLSATTTGDNNATLGAETLRFGNNFDSVAIGSCAGFSLGAAGDPANGRNYRNVAIGYLSTFNTLSGSGNTGVGAFTLYNHYCGDYNTAVGYGALSGEGSSAIFGNYNVAIGATANAYNTFGSNNVAIGNAALHNTQTGNCNIAIGTCALFSNLSGSGSIAIGQNALKNNTIGICNAAIGVEALSANTTGSYNVAYGVRALLSNTTGSCNLATGFGALSANTTGSNNIAAGHLALSKNTIGSCNIAVGLNALCSNTTGNINIAIGHSALINNTTGYYNIGIGTGAATGVTSGISNIAIGAYAYPIGVGGGNIIIGTTAGCYLFSSSLNTAIGDAALFGNIAQVAGYGSVLCNVAIGANALYTSNAAVGNVAVGINSMYGAYSGTYNVAIGFGALSADNFTGCRNTVLGAFALNSSTGTTNDNIAIGFSSLQKTTTGTQNVSIGSSALCSNTTGSCNIAIGHNSYFTNTTGASGIAIGVRALFSNTTGLRNITTGNESLFANTTGSDNTVYGLRALSANTIGCENIAIGNYSLSKNTTGNRNIAVGLNTLCGNITGSGNIAIGDDAGCLMTGTNNVIIGGYTGNAGGLDARSACGAVVLSDGAGIVRFYANSGSCVGINTVEPTNNLTVAGSLGLRPVAFNSASANPAIYFTGISATTPSVVPSASSIRLEVLPTGSVAFIGSAGTLFSITDVLTGSLMSVSNQSGLPIFEVFSNNSIVMGTYNTNALVVSGTNIGVGTNAPNRPLTVVGDISSTGTIYASSGNSNIWGYFPVSSISSTSFNVDNTFAYDYIRTTAATTVTATVLAASSTTWANNTEIIFEQAGAGQILFNAAAGVTINTSETLYSQKQYSVVALKYVASNVWTLLGERQLV
jgi:hypothetical protein